MNRCWKLAAVAMMVFLWGAVDTLRAQVLTGSVLGKVTDDTGGVLPGVTVSLASPSLPSGEVMVVTESDGSFRFALVPPGTYTLRSTLQGFGIHQEEGLRVVANGTIER